MRQAAIFYDNKKFDAVGGPGRKRSYRVMLDLDPRQRIASADRGQKKLERFPVEISAKFNTLH